MAVPTPKPTDLVDDATIGRIAYIVGESSAASKAIAERDRRRGKGEDVHVFKVGTSFVVGPMPPNDASGTD